jgi:hypothetical protein
VSFVTLSFETESLRNSQKIFRDVQLTTMYADSSVNDWSSDEASESPPCDFPDSDGDTSPGSPVPEEQLRPAGLGLAFVSYADWRPALPYNEQPPEYIRYNVEWKLSVNNRQRLGESELGVVISPQKEACPSIEITNRRRKEL